ncbi:MAG: FtsW/RodA/SpoVE family cell cycle protein [Bacteroidales bacterium]|nr:FtsW/RodA/SpoVE family cell cycle protein [Bacteroidales bacterium]
MADKAKEKKGIWNWIDNIQGDKVIWMIVLLLIMISIIAIFSSTSMLSTSTVSRFDIFKEQLFIVALGLGIILACYFIPKIWIFRVLSQFGFAISAGMLLMLLGHISTVEINGAVRAIRIGGLQLNVYEFVKVGMILYLSWAVHAYKTDELWIANRLAKRFKFLEFIGRPGWKRIIYIHFPILFVCLCVLAGSFSSAMFIGAMMFATIIIGGIPFKDILYVGFIAVIAIISSYGIYKISGGKVFKRWGTVEKRIERFFSPQPADELKEGTVEWNEYIDNMRQPEGAKLAIREGGLTGKGPGRSTQKYAVALMFSDYMFSFILEEYGLLGAFVMIILYVSLLARGSIIVRNCDNTYAKTAVAGLVILISGQAMMHMYINVGLGPLTGQTLPMVSHGNSSFLAFSIAFGVLLSISKMAKKKVEQQAEMAGPLVDHSDDDIRAGLDDLDQLESMDSFDEVSNG